MRHPGEVAGWIFLGVSLVGAAFTLAALLRVRHLFVFTFPWFMAGWLTAELSLHHLAWQLVATLGFTLAGALETTPGMAGLAVTVASWAGLIRAHAGVRPAEDAVRASLAELPGVEHEPAEVAPASLFRPFRMKRPGVESLRNVAYGDPLPGDKGGRNLLDVVRPVEPGEGRPVLLQVHGGAWVYGEKEHQGQPLMHHLAERGWVCFAQNYRLAPRAPFPAQIVDVKRCLAWLREHAEAWGGDPDFVCITGGSAGGHLSALAALSAGDPSFQPGFEEADTSVSACVPFYGVYDFLDREGIRGPSRMTPFLERLVLKSSPESQREAWEAASPLSRIHADAPPFFVVQGSHDTLVFAEEARHFVGALREKSRAPVLYLEVPGAQHAFDTFHSVRSRHAVAAVTAFLRQVHTEAGGGPDA